MRCRMSSLHSLPLATLYRERPGCESRHPSTPCTMVQLVPSNSNLTDSSTAKVTIKVGNGRDSAPSIFLHELRPSPVPNAERTAERDAEGVMRLSLRTEKHERLYVLTG